MPLVLPGPLRRSLNALLGCAAVLPGLGQAQDLAPPPSVPLPLSAMPADAPVPVAPLSPSSAGAEAEQGVQWELEVQAADETLRALLAQHLDLARYRSTAQTERITRAELMRLLAATPRQAQDLLETEGYFDAKVSTRLEPVQGSRDGARASAWLDPVTLATKVASELESLIRLRKPSTDDGVDAAPDLRVVVQVEPGLRTRVRDVRVEFEGPLSVSADAGDPLATDLVDRVRKGWTLRPRRGFTQRGWSAAKSQAVGLLRAEGYLSASWSGSVAQVLPQEQTAQLFLVADSGPLFRFGEPHFEGLDYVKPDALRAVLNFSVGEPLREKALLDYQDRLVKTGLFNTVSVTIDPDPATADATPVSVRVRERDRLQTTFGVGVSDNTGPRATIEHVDQHIFGFDWQAKSRLQFGRVVRGASLDLTSHPRQDAHRNLVSAAVSHSEADDNLTVDNQKVRVGRTQDSERFERLYYLEWQHARTAERVVGGDVDDASAVSGAYQWVWRNLDHPITPTDGFSLSASLAGGRSFATVGESGWFTRATGRLTGYRKFGTRWYGQARVEAGEVFKRDSVSVPYTLLFRAGGDDSVRGYSYQSLGPSNVRGTAQGGKVMATSSVEMATPFVRRKPAWMGAVFFDAGNSAANWKEFELARGYGVGVRWNSPLGALRIDLAYGEKVRRARLHFSVGLTF